MVVAGQVRLALTIEHGDWPMSALPGGGSCRRGPQCVGVMVKGKENTNVSRSARKRRDGSRKRQQQALWREGDTRCRVRGGFSLCSPIRDTLPSVIRSVHVARVRACFSFSTGHSLVLQENHMTFALNPKSVSRLNERDLAIKDGVIENFWKNR